MTSAVDPFDLPRTEACERVADELAEAGGTLREGGDLGARHPAVAAHLASCLRCRIVLADLMNEPEEMSNLTTTSVDPVALFDRALMAGLSQPEPVARARAAEGFGTLHHPGARALAALAMTATDDTDATVAKAKSLGAAVFQEPTDIPPGRFAVLADPQGAMFNVIKMAPAS